MTRSLPDVNVLLALLDLDLDVDHVDHDRAHAWLDQAGGDGWTSCPSPRTGSSAPGCTDRQVTDAYLLALAVAHGGRFVTFDRTVSPGRGRRGRTRST